MAAKLCPIMDPDYNRRKICKEMILLEDHLFKACERCRDCIRKHLLKIQALSDEMGSLDKTGKYTSLSNALSAASDEWLNEIEKINFASPKADKALHSVGQRIRRCRKKLVSSTLRSDQMANGSNGNGNDIGPSLNSLEEEVDSLNKVADEELGGVVAFAPQTSVKDAMSKVKTYWRDLPSSYKTVIGTGAALLGGAWLLK